MSVLESSSCNPSSSGSGMIPSAPPTSPSTPDPADLDSNPSIQYLNILQEDEEQEDENQYGFENSPQAEPTTDSSYASNTCSTVAKFDWTTLDGRSTHHSSHQHSRLWMSTPHHEGGIQNTPRPPLLPHLICSAPFFTNTTSSSGSTDPTDQQSGPSMQQQHCLALVPYESRPLVTKMKGGYFPGGHPAYPPTEARKVKRKGSPINSFKYQYYTRRLFSYCSSGNYEGVQSVLSQGLVSPNVFDAYHRAPLHLAACKGHDSIVRLLLEYGADPNQKDILGNTPLHLAACTNHFHVVTSLLRGGTDVRTLDNSGRNPLQLAESKLKLIVNGGGGGREDVRAIITMMLEYLNRKDPSTASTSTGGLDSNASAAGGLLHAFASKLSLEDPSSDLDLDLSLLLANLQELNLGNNYASAS